MRETGPTDAGFEGWKHNVRASALDAFTRVTAGFTHNARGLRSHAIAETELRADARIDSHWSNRVVPGGQGRVACETETADLLWIG